MSNIPEDVVVAAAKAFYNDPQGLTDWDLLASVEPDMAGRYRSDMSRALEAALPIIRKELAARVEREAGPRPNSYTHYSVSAALEYWDGMMNAADIVAGEDEQ